MNDHRLVDACSREMHLIIAGRIAENSAPSDRARRPIERWRPTHSSRSLPYLDRWQALLDAGAEPMMAKLLEHSEDGDLMRHTSPLAGVLTNEERWEFSGKYSSLDAVMSARRSDARLPVT